jgi:hypothetical protein
MQRPLEDSIVKFIEEAIEKAEKLNNPNLPKSSF